MRKPAMRLAFPLLLPLVWACGQPFAYVTTGSGGAGGGGAGGSTSGSTVDTGTTSSTGSTSTSASASGNGCDPAKPNACGGNRHCQTSDCKKGTCVDDPAPYGNSYAPVCGCDKNVYWNPSLPIAAGVAYREGGCDPNKSPSGVTTCTATSDNCGEGLSCYLRSPALLPTCAMPPSGVCMKMPPCDNFPYTAHACGEAVKCTNLCDLVTTNHSWYEPVGSSCVEP